MITEREYLNRCIDCAHDMMTKLLEIYDVDENERQAPDDVCQMVNEFLNLYTEMIDAGIVETFPIETLFEDKV